MAIDPNLKLLQNQQAQTTSTKSDANTGNPAGWNSTYNVFGNSYTEYDKQNLAKPLDLMQKINGSLMDEGYKGKKSDRNLTESDLDNAYKTAQENDDSKQMGLIAGLKRMFQKGSVNYNVDGGSKKVLTESAIANFGKAINNTSASETQLSNQAEQVNQQVLQKDKAVLADSTAAMADADKLGDSVDKLLAGLTDKTTDKTSDKSTDASSSSANEIEKKISDVTKKIETSSAKEKDLDQKVKDADKKVSDFDGKISTLQDKANNTEDSNEKASINQQIEELKTQKNQARDEATKIRNEKTAVVNEGTNLLKEKSSLETKKAEAEDKEKAAKQAEAKAHAKKSEAEKTTDKSQNKTEAKTDTKAGVETKIAENKKEWKAKVQELKTALTESNGNMSKDTVRINEELLKFKGKNASLYASLDKLPDSETAAPSKVETKKETETEKTTDKPQAKTDTKADIEAKIAKNKQGWREKQQELKTALKASNGTMSKDTVRITEELRKFKANNASLNASLDKLSGSN